MVSLGAIEHVQLALQYCSLVAPVVYQRPAVLLLRHVLHLS